MANHPLRLKIFTFLFILDIFLTYLMTAETQKQVAEGLPSPFPIWIHASFAAIFVLLLLLLALLWTRNRIVYILALMYVSYGVATYFIIYPAYPQIFLVLESAELALLLSLFNYYFGKP